LETIPPREAVPPQPGILEPGGLIERNLLRGQLPVVGGAAGGLGGGALGAAAGGIGAVPGGIAGAGLGGAAGQNLQDIARQLLGFDQPIGGPEAFRRAGTQGAISATAQALPVGPALGAARRVAGAAARPIARRVGAKIATTAIPEVSKQEVRQVVSGTRTPIGIRAAEKGIFGTKKQIQRAAEEGLESLGKELDAALEGEFQTVDVKAAGRALNDLRTQFQKVGEKGFVKQIDKKLGDFVTRNTAQGPAQLIELGPTGNIIQKGESVLIPKEANQLKRYFQSIASKTFGKDVTAQASVKKQFAKELSRGLRQEIEKAVPRSAIKQINKDLKFYIELSDAISESLTKDISNNAFRTFTQDIVPTAGIAGLGFAAGGDIATAVSAGTGLALIRSTPAKTFLAAQLLKKGPNVAQEMMVHPTFRKAIFNAMGSIGKQVGLREGIERTK
jgi:hypothetical protein